MMDPLSTLASVGSLAQITAQVVVLGNTYYRSYRSQSEDIKRLVSEIGLLHVVLNQVENALKPPVDGSLRDRPVSPHIIQGPLTGCQADVSDLHQFLLKQMKGKNRLVRLGRRVTWPMRDQEVKDWIGRIERRKTSFMLALSADGRDVSGKIFSEMAAMKRGNEEDRKEAREAKKRQKYRDVKTWLSPATPQDCHMAARKQRQQDTGRVLLDGPTYTQWKGQSGGFLWMYGCSGFGKTILASTIIDSLSLDSYPKHLAYFYFDHTNPQKRTPAQLYGSLLAQILDAHHPELPSNIEQHFDKNCFHRPLESELLDLLNETLDKVPGYTFVIDGLDKCSNRLSLVQALPTIKARVLVLSCEEPDIFDEYEYLPKLELTPDLVEADISKFVEGEIARQPKLRRLNAPMKAQITDVIVGRRKTFRWVRESLENVAKQRTESAVRDALQSLMEHEGEDGYDSGMGYEDGDDDDD